MLTLQFACAMEWCRKGSLFLRADLSDGVNLRITLKRVPLNKGNSFSRRFVMNLDQVCPSSS